MKIAVLSDIHGNAIALKAVINDLKELNINKIIVLGDIVIKGPMPAETLEVLRNSGLEILAWVQGNTDLWFKEMDGEWKPKNEKEKELYQYFKYAYNRLKTEEKELLRSLPFKSSIKIDDVDILCVHGTPTSIITPIGSDTPEEVIEDIMDNIEEQVLLCGHSHKPFMKEINNKKIFNVGSIGNSLDGNNNISYGILEINDIDIRLENRRLEYNIQKIIKIAIENDFPNIDNYKEILLNAKM